MKLRVLFFILIHISFVLSANPVLEIFHGRKILDMHVHTAGLGAGGSGCFVSEDLRTSFKFGKYLDAFGVTLKELETQGDKLIIRKIEERVRSSQYLGGAIVLAADGVIDSTGRIDSSVTEIYVPNAFLYSELEKYPNLYFGASVNPRRRDALKRLEKAAAMGAKLIKWIPNIQLMNPSDSAFVPFYKKLAELSLPLLVHTGTEHSFTRSTDSLGDPALLELPLKVGVTVIAAHVASQGKADGIYHTDRLFQMMREYPKLYTDISSLTQINKLRFLKAAVGVKNLHDRMFHGSDFPLPYTALVSPYYLLFRMPFKTVRAIAGIDHPLDQDILIKYHMGFPRELFYQAGAFFKTEKGW